jgi:ubiquinone/menaquinone biosynthesis C-methylase UbiE
VPSAKLLLSAKCAQNCLLKEKEETAMDKPTSSFHFKVMSLAYKFRDLHLPRMSILKEVGIKPGFRVLDYGCGSGSYIIPLVELVGESGKVYALDMHPLAIRKVQSIASKKKLTNVETILSNCQTGLPNDSLDVVLLYDIFHHLSDPNRILEELYRVLKPDGTLSFSDHHMKENEIVSGVTNSGLFKLARKSQRTYTFSKL